MTQTNHTLQRKVQFTIDNLDFKGLYTPINKVYFLKYIKYGNYIDITNYKKIRLSYKNPNKSFVRSKNNKRTDRSIQRTRENIYRLAQANTDNFWPSIPIFSTFKYHRNIKDIPTAYRDFRLFIKRLNYHFNFPIRYICVPEFQKRGAVHFHAIFFDFPFTPVKKIEKLWSHGSHNQGVDWQLAKNINSTSCYLLKYITKDLLDKRLQGKRILLTSRNLIRPIHSFDSLELDILLTNNIINTVDVFENKFIRKSKIKLCN
jgi:hypothetical protein